MSFFVDSIVDVECGHLFEQVVARRVAVRFEGFRMDAVGGYGLPVRLWFLL